MVNRFIYIITVAVLKILNHIPFRIACQIGKSMGCLLYLLTPKHRRLAFENMKNSFPEKSEREIRGLVKKTFIHLGLMLPEIASAYGQQGKWIDKTVSFEGSENLDKALQKGKGVLLVTAHIGSWEVGAIGYGRSRFPFNCVVRPLDNPYVNEMLEKARGLFGTGIISKRNAVRQTLKCLKKNEVVAVLMDQNMLKEQGVFVDFFGRPACTSPIVAIMALRTGCPVLPTCAIRTAPGKIKVFIGEEVEVIPSGNYQSDVQHYTEKFTKLIEFYIRKYPAQWFWVHNRWKTQPENENN